MQLSKFFLLFVLAFLVNVLVTANVNKAKAASGSSAVNSFFDWSSSRPVTILSVHIREDAEVVMVKNDNKLIKMAEIEVIVRPSKPSMLAWISGILLRTCGLLVRALIATLEVVCPGTSEILAIVISLIKRLTKSHEKPILEADWAKMNRRQRRNRMLADKYSKGKKQAEYEAGLFAPEKVVILVMWHDANLIPLGALPGRHPDKPLPTVVKPQSKYATSPLPKDPTVVKPPSVYATAKAKNTPTSTPATTNPSAPVTPQQSAPSYTCGVVLGSGAFGEVLACTAPSGRKVVMKKVKVEHGYDVMTEVHILQDLEKGPWILECVDSFYIPDSSNTPTSLAIVTERMSMDMVKYRDNFGLSANDVHFISYGMAAGLQYIHVNGFIHRDVKPDNILVNIKADGTLMNMKLADFGVAIKAKSTSGKAGTPGYAAPEVMAGQTYTRIADWFSMGATLFNLTCKWDELPFGWENDTDILLQRMRECFKNQERSSVPWLPYLPVGNEFEDLMFGLLELNSAKRLGRDNNITGHPYFANIPRHWELNRFEDC
ncbi:Serine/threonine kinase [Phlyctochytrium planicorne]|nr:Serine/threonine kinase [Phlyctochytrium planicorne]